MSSIEKHHKKGGSKLEGEGEKVIYILSVFSWEKSEFAKKNMFVTREAEESVVSASLNQLSSLFSDPVSSSFSPPFARLVGIEMIFVCWNSSHNRHHDAPHEKKVNERQTWFLSKRIYGTKIIFLSVVVNILVIGWGWSAMMMMVCNDQMEKRNDGFRRADGWCAMIVMSYQLTGNTHRSHHPSMQHRQDEE